MSKTYIAIDLKSFYASVECNELGLDPMNTNLIVADKSRTEKTICLAVSPSLKLFGVPGRPRLYQVIEQIKKVNYQRRLNYGKELVNKSHFFDELMSDKSLEVSYIMQPPRMSFYIDYSTRIYEIYLKYVAAEDIHVYSIDEVFIDATKYLKNNKLTAREFAMKIIKDVLFNVGITATAGIGPNLYLAKVAMDIVAKHAPADKNGVRIAELNYDTYRKYLWSHEPITDFWRVGKGYAKKLEKLGLFTMGDIAKCSVNSDKSYINEKRLYETFGVNAELLIDHAWGYEPCTIADIKSYKPKKHSIGLGQVLQDPYDFDKAKVVTMEMLDSLSLELVEKGFLTDQVVIMVGYDVENLINTDISKNYKGKVVTDSYGRNIPKASRVNVNLDKKTSSTKHIIERSLEEFDKKVNANLLVRRINISMENVVHRESIKASDNNVQLNLFMDLENVEDRLIEKEIEEEKELSIQKAILDIKKKYGKNAILKGTNFRVGATAKSRNKQIGGHKA